MASVKKCEKNEYCNPIKQYKRLSMAGICEGEDEGEDLSLEQKNKDSL